MLNQLFRKKPIGAATGSEGEIHGAQSLGKHLSLRDLTFFGIAAIIGAGSFSSMGTACFNGGPGVVFLFILCAVACGFTALCYADFAARVPVSGSAYTYAYVSFGELFAWIIGWALLMEYSIGNIYVAFAWSGYFTNLLDGLGLHMPEWLTINYTAAHIAFDSGTTGEGTTAWNTAPMLAGLRIIFDLPAFAINAFITWLVYTGVKESRNVSNIMVVVKLAIIVLVIIVGAAYVDIDNWTPWMPNGFSGVMAGVSAVFFAYIGFDAVSTLAEESKNPQRDLPKGMIISLVVCTAVYIALALVLTGMVGYKQLGVSDPLAEVFAIRGVKWMLFIVSIAAVVAMTSVMLVFQLGQPRIWMSMSRDGLLPKRFASIHPRYKTPGFSTIVTGLVVGIPIFFTDENFILDFTSIGTLFAFVLVCGGVLLMPRKEREPGRFHLPYFNAKFIVPLLGMIALALIVTFDPNHFHRILGRTGGDVVVPMIVFYLLCVVMAWYSFRKQWSLIPVLGLISCCYLLTGMAVSNWKWFAIWLVIGLACYFAYGYRHSRLAPSAP
ncbi:MAG: amino acid permease [Flavobacteriales bacterium]|nr:amino acid permease [Flavobacteriales bacterium]MBK9538240.1 amino acid permease [Flavobacteriales bacterium]